MRWKIFSLKVAVFVPFTRGREFTYVMIDKILIIRFLKKKKRFLRIFQRGTFSSWKHTPVLILMVIKESTHVYQLKNLLPVKNIKTRFILI